MATTSRACDSRCSRALSISRAAANTAALLDGGVGPGQLETERVLRADVQDLLARVDVFAAADLTAAYPERTSARVHVLLRDGRQFDREQSDRRVTHPAHVLGSCGREVPLARCAFRRHRAARTDHRRGRAPGRDPGERTHRATGRRELDRRAVTNASATVNDRLRSVIVKECPGEYRSVSCWAVRARAKV